MEIYRSESGRRLVQEWCRRELTGALPSAQRRVVETSLGPTHLTSVGSGAPVVLLPGTNFGAATSLPLISALGTSFQVTVVDLPGQPGLSSGVRPNDDLVAQHRQWLAQVFTEVRRAGRPLLVIGESLGAAIALCAEPGPHIGGLVLVVPAGLIGARVDLMTLAATLPWLMRPTPGRAARLIETMSGGATLLDRDRLVEWMTMVPKHARSSLAPAPLPNGVLTAWRSTPCRILAGGEDRFYAPRRLVEPARRTLHASTTVVADAGHLLTHTAPDVVADVTMEMHQLIGDAA